MADPCKDNSLLSMVLDDELSPAVIVEITNHLRTCIFCKQHLAALEKIDKSIRQLPMIEPSPKFNGNFWQKVEKMG